jgi:hypothetical protein
MVGTDSRLLHGTDAACTLHGTDASVPGTDAMGAQGDTALLARGDDSER